MTCTDPRLPVGAALVVRTGPHQPLIQTRITDAYNSFRFTHHGIRFHLDRNQVTPNTWAIESNGRTITLEPGELQPGDGEPSTVEDQIDTLLTQHGNSYRQLVRHLLGAGEGTGSGEKSTRDHAAR